MYQNNDFNELDKYLYIVQTVMSIFKVKPNRDENPSS